jgi:hypothetical protein
MKLKIITIIITIILKYLLLLEVPEFAGHLENNNRSVGLQPAAGRTLLV